MKVPEEPEYDPEVIANAHLTMEDDHYKCSVCKMKFKQPGNARRHIITVHRFVKLFFAKDEILRKGLKSWQHMEGCHAPVREISAHPDLEMSGQNWRNFRAFLFSYCTKLQSDLQLDQITIKHELLQE